MNQTVLQRKDGRLTAILGPTNTGKTHLAVERMCRYRTGMIGLPLRLLAREIYDRLSREKGLNQVALITGEEKILPPKANYYVCTVESMPLDAAFDFVAIDEVQLCADLDRGHVFTDRLLHMRGLEETLFLGANTIRPLLTRLFENIEFISRPRFSELRYAGEKKVSRLPRRSAIVAFSAADVYAIAELIRRQRGGSAVVMGALSPRTRNAQVALYQAGEVDYLVATDAIGMGLNMDVDHVAFAGSRKYDGFGYRALNAAEIGQIAGRAGRHLNDGSFGTTAGLSGFDQDMVEAVENHRFDPLQKLQWRNRKLNFQSTRDLLYSLRKKSQREELVQARDAEDVNALKALMRDSEVGDALTNRHEVARLWDVCRIPDFRKNMPDNHYRLLRQIFGHLSSGAGTLPEDWLAPLVARLDNVEGDVDALANRIAFIRTWTYVANRSDWLNDPAYWRGLTRDIEDRLSDALHAKLTQRFVDRRTAVLFQKLKDKQELLASVSAEGEVLVEGQFVGRLRGLQFKMDKAQNAVSHLGAENKAIRAAANRVLVREVERVATRIIASSDTEFDWRDDNRIYWRGAPVGRLQKGVSYLRPDLQLEQADHLTGHLREQVRQRLIKGLSRDIENGLAPLFQNLPENISASARGIWFQLCEGLGNIPRDQVSELILQLTPEDRKHFRRMKIRFGYLDVFLPGMIKPARSELALRLLCCAHELDLSLLKLPGPGLVSVRGENEFKNDQMNAVFRSAGFRLFPGLALRLDILDRFADMVRQAYQKDKPLILSHEMVSIAGSGMGDLIPVMKVLGYRVQKLGSDDPTEQQAIQFIKGKSKQQAKRPNRRAKGKKTKNNTKSGDRKPSEVHSPFSVLRALKNS